MNRRRLLAALASCLAAGARAATPGEIGIGGRLPDVLLEGLNGPPRRLAEFRGRPLIINVWASWCEPCREEMASLERLAWRDPDAPWSVIGISTDDYADRAMTVLRESHATIAHYIDHQLRMENLLGASHIPLTVLVGADGRVRAKFYGAREWDTPASLRLIDRAFARGG